MLGVIPQSRHCSVTMATLPASAVCRRLLRRKDDVGSFNKFVLLTAQCRLNAGPALKVPTRHQTIIDHHFVWTSPFLHKCRNVLILHELSNTSGILLYLTYRLVLGIINIKSTDILYYMKQTYRLDSKVIKIII